MTSIAIQEDNPGLQAIRQQIRKGYTLIVGLLMVFSVFMGIVPIKTAAIAPGKVIMEGEKKTIQHLEGGIIRQILVKEGDLVKQDQILASLDETRLRTEASNLETQLILLYSREARWQAQMDKQETLVFSPWLLERRTDPQVARAMEDQQNLYASSLKLFREQQKSLQIQMAQAREKSRSSQQQWQQNKQQTRKIDQEISKQQALLAKGLITRNLLLELEEKASNSAINNSALASESTVYQQQADQIGSELGKLEQGYQTDAAEKLDELKEQIATTERNLLALQQQLARADIRAPISGHVVNMHINTQGGVVSPGQTLLEIVPSQGSQMVEARVNPRDRDVVRAGQAAEVRFSAFNQNEGQPIHGTVKLISADSLAQSGEQQAYYKTLIELDAGSAQLANGINLYPGMQAEVMIVTGEKSLLSYITSPLTASFNRALTEN